MVKLSAGERKTLFAYTFICLGLGFLFPLTAFVIDAVDRDTPLFTSIRQHANPLLYIIDLAPLILGLIGLSTGCREVRLKRLAKDQVHKQLEAAEVVGAYGSWKIDLPTQQVEWSKGLFRLLNLDPEHHPVSYDVFRSYIVQKEKLEALETAVAACISGSIEEFEVEYEMRLANASEKRFITKGAKVIQKDRAALIGITRDITELAKAREIALTADLERAKAEGITAAIVTCKHEINNPLAIALGAIQVLPRDSGTREKLEAAESALWRVAELVKKMDELTAHRNYELQRYGNSSQQMVKLKSSD